MKRIDHAKLVFIGGSPRSGTTLVQRLVGAHSQVYAGPEFDFTPKLADLRDKMVASVENGRISAIVSAEMVDQSFQNFFQGIFDKKAAEVKVNVFCEKTPANILHFQTLSKIFPDAKFIMVLRDPFEIVSSMWEVFRKYKNLNKRLPYFLRDVQLCAKEINRYWEAGFQALNTSPQRVMVVHYADILENPENIASRLCHFLELPEESDMTKIEEVKFDATETGIAEWYTKDQLMAPIKRSVTDVKQTRLTMAERDVVARTITVKHPALDRYNLQNHYSSTGKFLIARLKVTRRIRQFGNDIKKFITP